MVRRSLFGLVLGGSLAFVISPFADLGADPPADPDATFKNTLIVQGAMEQARFALVQNADAKKAVFILEEHLARINGDAVYLRLLRDAYRAYVKDLHMARQEGLAQKYVERLAILDRNAARDAGVRPSVAQQVVQDAKTLTKAVTAPAVKLVGKSFDLAKQMNPLPKIMASQPGKPATVRAKIEEKDDPFDPAFRRTVKQSDGRIEEARKLLQQAEVEYSKRRYSEARLLYDKAHRADPNTTGSARPRWAYCKLSHVVDSINESNFGGASVSELKREVQLAMEMAPNLADTGNDLLKQLEGASIKKGVAGNAAANLQVTIHHSVIKGWHVAETANFRIYHNQKKDFAENVAKIAERTRLDMYRKWFGNDGPAWSNKCDLILHANGTDYQRATGVSPQNPGHSRFETESSGRVVVRRMEIHCDVPGILDAVLPHETTHVVLAGMFGRQPIPRWADEGMAVLTEPKEKVDQHRRNLTRSQQEGQLFAVRDLMNLQEYPQPRLIAAFYAQSVVLVDFLTQERGPRVFADFLKDGLQGGYEQALRKHYSFRDFDDLQSRWNRQLATEANRMNVGFTGR